MFVTEMLHTITHRLHLQVKIINPCQFLHYHWILSICIVKVKMFINSSFEHCKNLMKTIISWSNRILIQNVLLNLSDLSQRVLMKSGLSATYRGTVLTAHCSRTHHGHSVGVVGRGTDRAIIATRGHTGPVKHNIPFNYKLEIGQWNIIEVERG